MDKSADMQEVEKGFVQVVIPSPVKEPLLYQVPPALQGRLEVGMRVLVPLGKRKVTGVVFDFAQETSLEKVREVLTVLDDRPILDPPILKLCRWISNYYISPVGEVLSTALPPLLRLESKRMVVLREPSLSLSGKVEKEVFAVVAKRRRILLKTLARLFPGGGFYRALGRLVSTGAVEIEEKLRANRKREMIQEPGVDPEVRLSPQPGFALTGEQASALQSMEERLMGGGFETFLLSGVTGSGKTEVYMRAMEMAWKRKKRSLILVPEISLTPQLLDRLKERFPGQVGILHSALTSTERSTQWWRISQGDVSVVVGARSALFAPVPDLGLIIVDEEHDSSYKQEEGLRYQARDLAVVRGKLTDCPVLLGSATPSLESFHNCRLGRYKLLELAGRVEGKALPQVEMVDLRVQPRDQQPSPSHSSPATSLFSPQLREALQANQASGQQSLIFLNRRGFANFLQCRLCGFVL
ncbi:MAG: primosomal protein N', partial [Candidatus Binatia bacterium]